MTGSFPVAGAAPPERWALASLGDIANLTRGVSWKKSEESTDGVPVITIPNVRNGMVDFDVAYRLSRTIPADKLLTEGDILLVGSSGSIENVGRAAVVPLPPFPQVTFASFLIRAAPAPDKMTRAFLGQLLTSSLIDFRAVARRAADGKWNLQLEELKNHPVVYPIETAEQEAICRALAAVSRTRESHQALTDALGVLFDSLRAELLAGRRRVTKP